MASGHSEVIPWRLTRHNFCICSLIDLRGMIVPDPADVAERGQYGAVASSQQVKQVLLSQPLTLFSINKMVLYKKIR